MDYVAIDEEANQLRMHLLAQLADTRRGLGLSQSEVADRASLSRMTVQRAEGDDGNIALASFIELSLAMGLTPRLIAPGEHVSVSDEPASIDPLPENIVHRGYSHYRTRSNQDWEDRRREAALAKSWELVNVDHGYGLSPIMKDLVPGHTQAQASAAATVVQWLGSEVGFDFLTRALRQAGYTITKLA